jgi:flagellar M-ring protein FliF
MKNQLATWAKKVWGDFKSFSPGQKAVTIVAIAALVVGGILFASWKSKPEYAPLYSNLSAPDAAAVVDKLSDDGIDYKLADGGSQILVPKYVVYDTRLKMSSDGLPNSSSGGYSLLDKEGITTSDFKQQVDFQRAIEGELEKTIEAMDGVQAASVHLAIPKKDVFNDGSKKPTAAVMLTMKPGASVSDAQVQSVVYLVSSSVPELDSDQVTVADSAGTVLAAPGDDLGGIGGTDARTQATERYNQRVSSALQTMLNKAVGQGNSVVTVNADLDFDHTSTTTKGYTHDKKDPPVWTKQSTESYDGTQPGDGTFGTGDPKELDSTSKQNGTYTKKNKTVTNSLGTVTKTVKNTPGNVEKLSVAVLLDSGAGNVKTGAIRKLVTSAVGLDPSRGDTLAIQAMAFNTSAADAAKKAAAAEKAADAAKASHEKMMTYIKQGAIGGVILLVLVLTIIASKRRKRGDASPQPDDDVELMTHPLPEGALLQQPPHPAAEEAEPTVVGDGGAGRRALVALADEQPDDVARVLSGWLGSAESAR